MPIPATLAAVKRRQPGLWAALAWRLGSSILVAVPWQQSGFQGRTGGAYPGKAAAEQGPSRPIEESH